MHNIAALATWPTGLLMHYSAFVWSSRDCEDMVDQWQSMSHVRHSSRGSPSLPVALLPCSDPSLSQECWTIQWSVALVDHQPLWRIIGADTTHILTRPPHQSYQSSSLATYWQSLDHLPNITRNDWYASILVVDLEDSSGSGTRGSFRYLEIATPAQILSSMLDEVLYRIIKGQTEGIRLSVSHVFHERREHSCHSTPESQQLFSWEKDNFSRYQITNLDLVQSQTPGFGWPVKTEMDPLPAGMRQGNTNRLPSTSNIGATQREDSSSPKILSIILLWGEKAAISGSNVYKPRTSKLVEELSTQ